MGVCRLMILGFVVVEERRVYSACLAVGIDCCCVKLFIYIKSSLELTLIESLLVLFGCCWSIWIVLNKCGGDEFVNLR